MVATRKSLPDASTDPPPSVHDRSLPIEVRRLHINGKDTMRGEAPRPREEKVYHWRGAAYAITDDTRQEWLDQEPKRWKQRSLKRGDTPEADERVAKRRRRNGTHTKVRKGDGEVPQRRSLPSQERRLVRQPSREGRRPRMSLSGPDSQRQKSSPAARKTRDSPQKEASSPLRFDFFGGTEDEMHTHVARERRTARRKGYVVEMLPPTRSREEREREALGYHIAANVRHMATLNSRISALQERWERLRATLRKRRDSPVDSSILIVGDASSTATPPIGPSPELTGMSSETTPPTEEEPPSTGLPTHNRGGQVLRWSLTGPPRLSHKLGDGQRAESEIFKGRLNGESKQARRRRIRREMEILRGWEEEQGVGG